MLHDIDNDLRHYVVRFTFFNMYGRLRVAMVPIEAFNRQMAISLVKSIYRNSYWTRSMNVISAKLA